MDRGKNNSSRRGVGLLRSVPKKLRRVLMSVVSFVLVFVLLTSMSFSWFTIKTSVLEAKNFVLDCGKGLRVNDTGVSQLSFQEANRELVPASSVDGRNIFFPTDGSDFSAVTESMTFRSANVGDKNQNYIQIDFTLTAQQNHTALYIDDTKTSIKVRGNNPVTEYSTSQAAALRSALWCSTAEEGVPNTPVVFNPTASTVYTAAVADVDRSSGAFIASGRQVAHAFSEYAFGGSPVATLSKGIETKFSYIIWLEGTDPKCTDKMVSKDIEIKLAFTTSWDKTQTIRFKDETGSNIYNKINSDHYTLSLRYQATNSSEYTDFNMYTYNDNDHNDHTVWFCNIPGDMRNEVSFILRPSANSSDTQIYEFRYDTSNNSTLNRESNRLYVADDLNAVTGTTYYGHGHWVAVGDSDGSGHDNGGGFEGDDF